MLFFLKKNCQPFPKLKNILSVLIYPQFQTLLSSSPPNPKPFAELQHSSVPFSATDRRRPPTTRESGDATSLETDIFSVGAYFLSEIEGFQQFRASYTCPFHPFFRWNFTSSSLLFLCKNAILFVLYSVIFKIRSSDWQRFV